MPDPEPPRAGNAPAVDPLLEILLAGVRSAVLRAGLELRIWARIAGGARTAAGIAAAEGWDADGARRLLDALCGMGFLGKNEEGYRLVPIAERYLVPGEPSYMGDFILADLCWESRGDLAGAIRAGKRPIDGSWTDERFSGVWRAWTAPHRADPGRGLESFDAIWSLLGVEPRQGLRVLDLACGSALKTLALARRDPGVKLCLQDREEVLEAAAGIARGLGIRGQVELLPGDLESVDLGRGRFDVAFLGHILHYLGAEAATALLRRVHTALAPGGLLAIHEDVPDDERREREYPLLESIWLYGVSAAGDTYTLPELFAILERAGFAAAQDAGEPAAGGRLIRAVRK